MVTILFAKLQKKKKKTDCPYYCFSVFISHFIMVPTKNIQCHLYGETFYLIYNRIIKPDSRELRDNTYNI